MLKPISTGRDPRLPKNFPELRQPGYVDKAPDGTGGGMLLPGRGGDRRNGDNLGILSAFMPGQQDALARQLNQGFGGGLPQWNGILSQAYSDMKITPNPLGYPRTKPDGTGKDRDDKGDKNGDGKPDIRDDGYNVGDDVFNSHSANGWMGAQGFRPGMQVAQPQMTMPSVQGPAQAMFGQQSQLNPQMLAFLRQRLMMGR